MGLPLTSTVSTLYIALHQEFRRNHIITGSRRVGSLCQAVLLVTMPDMMIAAMRRQLHVHGEGGAERARLQAEAVARLERGEHRRIHRVVG